MKSLLLSPPDGVVRAARKGSDTVKMEMQRIITKLAALVLQKGRLGILDQRLTRTN